ncbi:MAG: hypothetical protein AVDCRST_MAG39-670, partial [uncultured Sphingomonadaceae bacterium]
GDACAACDSTDTRTDLLRRDGADDPAAGVRRVRAQLLPARDHRFGPAANADDAAHPHPRPRLHGMAAAVHRPGGADLGAAAPAAHAARHDLDGAGCGDGGGWRDDRGAAGRQGQRTAGDTAAYLGRGAADRHAGLRRARRGRIPLPARPADAQAADAARHYSDAAAGDRKDADAVDAARGRDGDAGRVPDGAAFDRLGSLPARAAAQGDDDRRRGARGRAIVPNGGMADRRLAELRRLAGGRARL